MRPRKDPSLPGDLKWRSFKGKRTLYTYFKGPEGQIVERSTGTDDVAKARTFCNALRHSVFSDSAAGLPQDLPAPRATATGDLLEAMHMWDLDRAGSAGNRGTGRNAQYIKTLDLNWRTLRRHLLGRSHLNREGLQAYIKARRAERSLRAPNGPSNKYLKNELICLRRAMTEFCCRPKWSLQPIRPQDWPTLEHTMADRCDKTKGHHLERRDLQAFLSELRQAKSGDEHHALAVLHLLTGIRKEEGARLERGFVVWRESVGGYVLELPGRVTKNRLDRKIPLVPAAHAAALVLLGAPRRKEHAEAFRNASVRAGLTTAPHLRDLRHTFLTNADLYGKDRQATDFLAGHFSGKGGDLRSIYQTADPSRLLAVVNAVAAALGMLQK